MRPTPELVHGVIVYDPQLAGVLRRAGWFSGYVERLRDLPDGTVVYRDQVGPLPELPAGDLVPERFKPDRD
jgi:hypothetical protein